jgi:hypothetical protein
MSLDFFIKKTDLQHHRGYVAPNPQRGRGSRVEEDFFLKKIIGVIVFFKILLGINYNGHFASLAI